MQYTYKIASFTFSLISIYLVLFLISFWIYNTETASLDKEIDVLIKEQLSNKISSKNQEFAWQRIPYLQHIRLPVKPNISNPYSIYLFAQSLIFENKKELSGEHIYRLQEVIRVHRDNLRNISFNQLILVPKFNIRNGTIEESQELIENYLNFKNSDFQESSFQLSFFANVDLTNSNFYKSRFDETKVITSKLQNINLEGATLYKAKFYKSSLIDVNAKNILILYSSFELTELRNVDFSGATITDSSFNNADLQGTDFSDATLVYDNKENFLNSFKGALYNSQAINWDNNGFLFKNFEQNVQKYCNNKKDQDQDRKSICIKIMELNRDRFTGSVKATKFPKDFDPKNFDMIDVYEFIEYLKK